MPVSRSVASALEDLRRLHDEVDRLAESIAARHGPRLACRARCTSCCSDDLTVFEIEAERIRRECGAVLLGRPAPVGRCALLSEEGLCRAYGQRPYVCRTQGLPLRWLDEPAPGEVVERRDVCPVSEAAIPLLDLDPDDCWTIGPFEGRLAALQASLGVGPRRIRLRALFGPGQPEPGPRRAAALRPSGRRPRR